MARTVPEAFNQFKGNLALTEAQKSLVSSRRDNAHYYLSSAFPSTSDLPLLRTILMGSANRSTIIRPLNDLDVLAVFDNKDGIFEKYRWDSFSFINRVRNALNNFSVQIVGTRGQAVRLFYSTAPYVDIAPVFIASEGGYRLPNGQGGWLLTNPPEHDSHIATRHSQLNYDLKPLIRLIKKWNRVHSGRLRSFHLEVVTANLFTSIGNDSRAALEVFFREAQSSLRAYDPAGHSGDLSTYLTPNAWALVQASLESSRERAVLANYNESMGNHAEAMRHWRIILGSDFPSFS